jgi:oligopeptide transport system permease protein
MPAFIFRRIFIETIPTLLFIATLTFFLIRLAPGGPFSRDRNVTPEIQARLEAHYGLDKPLMVQYCNYMLNAVRGNLGPSFKYPNRTVNELIAASFPVSMELGAYSFAIACTAGILLGLLSAARHNTWTDYAAMSAAMTGICIPSFVLGPLLALVFALKLGWLNVSGWQTAGDRILPSLTLSAMYVAYIARLARGATIEILSQDFIRTARAKGAGGFRIVFVHALKGGLAPVVSFAGPAMAGLITGSFVVETIFQIPGLGRFFVMSSFNRDYTMILGTVLFYATLIILFNMMVDIAHVWLDPRLRSER